MNKKVVFLGLVLAVAFACVLFYSLSDREYVFRFTEKQIRENVYKKLPIVKDYMVVKVKLDNPRVFLENGSDRIYAGLDVELDIRLGYNKPPLGGTVDVSGEVRYDPVKGAFFLDNPKVESLGVQGIPVQFTDKVNHVLPLAFVGYYSKYPLYTLKSSDIKQSVAKLILKRVVVENNELVITLGI